MKAPDKIYIDDLAVVNDCITKNSTKPLPNFSEYIRKDALLEWARAEIELSKAVECVSEVAYEEGRQRVALNLIEKLNSM